MKVKVLGIQLKFAAAMILSLLLSFVLLCISTGIYSFCSGNIHNYNYSFSRLRYASEALSCDLNKDNFKSIEDLKPIFQKYEKQYYLFKMNFIVTDGGDRVLYEFKKVSSSVNFLKKANEDTMRAYLDQGNDRITQYCDFSYAIPIKMDNRIYMLWITGIPYNAVMDTSFNWINKKGFVIMLCLSVFIFYIITLSKMKYIKKICRGLNEIAGGKLDFRIEKKGHDELSKIASNVNYMADKIQDKIKREEEMQRSKNELVTNVAHDIRSPLTSIIGFLEIIDRNQYKSREEKSKFLSIALKKARVIKKLTDNLFMFTKLESPHIKLNLSSICINDLICQVVDEFSNVFEKNNLQLTDSITPENMMVQVDMDMFLRALNNLLYNALEYSVKPSEVKVSLYREGHRAAIYISNSCDNLEERDVKMLFERFYRADRARSNPDNNSGLGLSIARSIIEHHGGSITSNYKDSRICFKISMAAEKNDIG
ncbi:HAMP domain-containing sensor histidine kinase [Clostridium luticellarii]|uniref:histidine kinase n=1 Tax=Clostridium luticellarii TaxID=1691940 RepID=A0A2T0BNP8_9CLOT|nr:HAMP domain-containing sensor histidine kinase [Clostridium luticellarii]MCI1944418.1 HAMP domain-containing histidine kinase [Clostridium luticellarii]MCI1969144.1 HAMP domain-containing histidine kinase [Clostridium luticellarii]PRR85501.1 Sensor histidine kinase YycG [Clostridium luticellarii]